MARKNDTTTDEPAKTAALEANENTDGESAAETTGNDKTKKPTKLAALRIRAKVKSFRRAGLTFGEQPVDVALADLTKDQVAALKAEPMLVIEEFEAAIAPSLARGPRLGPAGEIGQ